MIYFIAKIEITTLTLQKLFQVYKLTQTFQPQVLKIRETLQLVDLHAARILAGWQRAGSRLPSYEPLKNFRNTVKTLKYISPQIECSSKGYCKEKNVC
jgi:hypothetical protein